MSQQTEPQTETVTITINGRSVEARKGEMIIRAAERAGVYIPRFCWHPRMKPVGMCRMCLVDIKGPRGFALQPACFVPVADEQEVVTDSPAVKKAQDGVLEFLLVNHPLDCPVCDRGGECPLQDQTFAFGPGESRFVEEKRHYEKPIALSQLVDLDRERCILCARCTRFADEIAGDPLINFVDRADGLQVLTFPDDPFSSYFSGNTVQICPVGALLARPYRFRARPWDLEQVESTCTVCSVGCRMAVQSSSNRLVRNLGIDSDPVNHSWLCDKGRFGFEAINHDDRLSEPLIRRDGGLAPAPWGEALRTAADGLRNVRDLHGAGAIAVLGGARLTNEDAYSWAKLAKAVIGTDSVDCQLGDGLPAEAVLGLPRATIDDACSAPAVIVLGPDIKEELPVLYLRLRAAALDGATKVIEVVPRRTGLSKYAATTLLYRAGEVGELARALAGAEGRANEIAGVAAAEINAARDAIGDGPVVVVLGRPSLAEPAASIADAAGALAGLSNVSFLSALRRGNVHGALDMGLAPGVLPGRVALDAGRDWFAGAWGGLPAERGLDATGILTAAAEGRVQGLVLLGADPLVDFPDRALAQRALAGAGFIVALDLFATESAKWANVVFPAAGFAEKAGTTTNIEGRVSRLNQKVTAPGTARPDWMIAAELALRLEADLGFDSVEAVSAEIERLAPAYAGVSLELLGRTGFRDGVVVPIPPTGPEPVTDDVRMDYTESPGVVGAADQSQTAGSDIRATTEEPATEDSASDDSASDQPARPAMLEFSPPPASTVPPVDAYSLRLVSSRLLYDDGTFVRHSASFAALRRGSRLHVNEHDLERLGVAPGDHVRVTSARQSLTIEVVADDGVPRGSAWLPFNQGGDGAADLIDATRPVTEVRLETVR